MLVLAYVIPLMGGWSLDEKGWYENDRYVFDNGTSA